MMYRWFGKRFLDIVISGVALVLLLPVFIVTGILVRMKLGSPVVFAQNRPGKDGRVFTMYKFRSMRNAIDSTGKPLPDKERMTAFGDVLRKLSLDELPELWNIFKGEMSLVGPRPLLVEYLEVYTEQERHRHDVLPGLTGWAQVNGRNAISWKKKFELDLHYVEHMSLTMDLRILWMTAVKVFKRSDINARGHVTVEKYDGMN